MNAEVQQCTTYTTSDQWSMISDHIRLTWASLRKYRFSMFHGFTVNHSLKTLLCLMVELTNGKLKMFCCADIFWAGSLLRGNIIGSWSRIWNVTSGWSNIFFTLYYHFKCKMKIDSKARVIRSAFSDASNASKGRRHHKFTWRLSAVLVKQFIL